MPDFDVIFAGGGLSTGLMALKLREFRPELRILVVEREGHLGGDHTWSFHGTDVENDELTMIKPMVRSRWSSQDVRFPALKRTLGTPYYTIVSADFDRYVRAQLGEASVYLNMLITEVTKGSVVLQGGQKLTAPCVIDGRGWQEDTGQDLALAYQKFFGLEVELQGPHGLSNPIIMDATVEQTDGYRFIYCLPYTPTSLLIEDTYYSPSMELDAAVSEREIRSYAEKQDWNIERVEREENGCLPIVLAGDASAFETRSGDAAPCGLRAGFFHPTTGYSLPDAVRVANHFARDFPRDTEQFKERIGQHSEAQWQKRKFYRLLNRLLFLGSYGNDKRKVMQRFYGMPQDLIERFYAGRSTSLDKLRVLSGKPPIPIPTAMRAIPARAAWNFVRAQ
ncbi:MAG: lycopene beta-cyclase CrtY [Pseudomonadota bacterium]